MQNAQEGLSSARQPVTVADIAIDFGINFTVIQCRQITIGH